jgi:hypothetical protein
VDRWSHPARLSNRRKVGPVRHNVAPCEVGEWHGPRAPRRTGSSVDPDPLATPGDTRMAATAVRPLIAPQPTSGDVGTNGSDRVTVFKTSPTPELEPVHAHSRPRSQAAHPPNYPTRDGIGGVLAPGARHFPNRSSSAGPLPICRLPVPSAAPGGWPAAGIPRRTQGLGNSAVGVGTACRVVPGIPVSPDPEHSRWLRSPTPQQRQNQRGSSGPGRRPTNARATASPVPRRLLDPVVDPLAELSGTPSGRAYSCRRDSTSPARTAFPSSDRCDQRLDPFL